MIEVRRRAGAGGGAYRMNKEERPGIQRLEHIVNINWVKIAVIFVISCLFIKYSDQIFSAGKLLFSTIGPLLYGFAIAYVLNIFMKKLEKIYFPKHSDGWQARTRRPVCVFASVILVLALIALLIGLVVPSLIDAIQVITKDIPSSFLQFQSWLAKLLEDQPELQTYVETVNVNWDTVFERIGEALQVGIGNLFNSAFSAANLIVSFIMTGIISLIFAIYMLFGKERLAGQIKKAAMVYAPKKPTNAVYRFFRLANETFTDFITGQLTEAVILGCLCGVGMALLRMPYALMVGVIVGATALIPVMGAYIGGLVGAIMIVTVSIPKAFEFIIFLVILQQVEGNLIYPRVVGGSIGLPGIWVLAAVTVGGGLLGIPGMLIGVPLAATVYKWIRNDIHQKTEQAEQIKNENSLTSPDESDNLSREQ